MRHKGEHSLLTTQRKLVEPSLALFSHLDALLIYLICTERGIKGFSLRDSAGCTVSAVSDAAQKQILKQTERGRARRGVRKGRGTKHGVSFLVGTMNGCDGGGGSEQESMGPDSQ